MSVYMSQTTLTTRKYVAPMITPSQLLAQDLSGEVLASCDNNAMHDKAKKQQVTIIRST